MAELKVWIGSVQRIISGVTPTTTSQEVIIALAQATGKVGRFTLHVKWKDYEKTLSPSDCPVPQLQQYGPYSNEVQFILRQTGDLSAPNRRLIEAKSPKPTRRRNQIKKSLSFSGGSGVQSDVTSRPSAAAKHSGIIHETTEEQPQIAPNDQVPSHPKLPRSHPKSASEPESLSERLAPQPPEWSHQPSQSKRGPSPTNRPSSKTRDRQTHSSRPSNSQPSHESSRSTKTSAQSAPPDRPPSRQREAQPDHNQLLSETDELQRILTDHELKLQEEQKRLNMIDADIGQTTSREEKKWETLYNCQEEFNKAKGHLKLLERELGQFDEYLISEEINSLIIQQKELEIEREKLRLSLQQLEDRAQASGVTVDSAQAEMKSIEVKVQEKLKENKEQEKEAANLERKLQEKNQFLVDAESGLNSACEELNDANEILNKRTKMLEELERELREYNLKSFITNGISDSNNYQHIQRTKEKPGDSSYYRDNAGSADGLLV